MENGELKIKVFALQIIKIVAKGDTTIFNFQLSILN